MYEYFCKNCNLILYYSYDSIIGCLNFCACVIQSGTLRFCGTTQFAAGMWAGVELDEAVGKNNGSVAGVQYFTCQPSYGINKLITCIVYSYM